MTVSKLWTAAVAGLAAMALAGCPAAKPAAPAAAISPVLADVVYGDPAAPVEIIEYGSLSCPHCRDFWMQEMPRLKERYIDTGKAKYVFRELSMGSLSDAVTAVARCAGKDKYYEAVAEAFARQYDISVAAGQGAAGGVLVEMGQKFGLTPDQIRTCIDSKDIATFMQKIQTEKPSYVSGLPTVIINGERIDRPFFTDMVPAIDAKLGANAPPPLAPADPNASPAPEAPATSTLPPG